MKNLTRKLMLSIVAIALVVIALGTSTFAWFTLSNKASVGQFNAEVTAGEGMELSLDGNSWYSTITGEKIQQQIKDNFDLAVAIGGAAAGLPPQLNGATIKEPIMKAVTTADLSSFKKLNANQTDYIHAIANYDFIEIKIWVRAVGLTTIKLDMIKFTGNDKLWASDASSFEHTPTKTLVQGDTVNVSAKNGARVGILAGAQKFAYEHDNIAYTYGSTAPSGNSAFSNDKKLDQGQAKYYEAKRTVPLVELDDAIMATKTTSDITSTPETILTLISESPVTDYNVGTFNMFVWFEGFDVDTFDAILKMPLTIEMSFIGS